jgi:hypothetical protein
MGHVNHDRPGKGTHNGYQAIRNQRHLPFVVPRVTCSIKVTYGEIVDTSRTRCIHTTHAMDLSRVCRDKHTNQNGSISYNPDVCPV